MPIASKDIVLAKGRQNTAEIITNVQTCVISGTILYCCFIKCPYYIPFLLYAN